MDVKVTTVEPFKYAAIELLDSLNHGDCVELILGEDRYVCFWHPAEGPRDGDLHSAEGYLLELSPNFGNVLRPAKLLGFVDYYGPDSDVKMRKVTVKAEITVSL